MWFSCRKKKKKKDNNNKNNNNNNDDGKGNDNDKNKTNKQTNKNTQQKWKLTPVIPTVRGNNNYIHMKRWLIIRNLLEIRMNVSEVLLLDILLVFCIRLAGYLNLHAFVYNAENQTIAVRRTSVVYFFTFV